MTTGRGGCAAPTPGRALRRETPRPGRARPAAGDGLIGVDTTDPINSITEPSARAWLPVPRFPPPSTSSSSIRRGGRRGLRTPTPPVCRRVINRRRSGVRAPTKYSYLRLMNVWNGCLRSYLQVRSSVECVWVSGSMGWVDALDQSQLGRMVCVTKQRAMRKSAADSGGSGGINGSSGERRRSVEVLLPPV